MKKLLFHLIFLKRSQNSKIEEDFIICSHFYSFLLLMLVKVLCTNMFLYFLQFSLFLIWQEFVSYLL